MKCNTCGEDIRKYSYFPGGICKKCWEKLQGEKPKKKLAVKVSKKLVGGK